MCSSPYISEVTVRVEAPHPEPISIRPACHGVACEVGSKASAGASHLIRGLVQVGLLDFHAIGVQDPPQANIDGAINLLGGGGVRGDFPGVPLASIPGVVPAR
jgi:hypothetical protein